MMSNGTSWNECPFAKTGHPATSAQPNGHLSRATLAAKMQQNDIMERIRHRRSETMSSCGVCVVKIASSDPLGDYFKIDEVGRERCMTKDNVVVTAVVACLCPSRTVRSGCTTRL